MSDDQDHNARDQPTQQPQPAPRVDDLQTELTQTRDKLQSVQTELDTARRRGRIDQTLMEARTVDLEAARLLTEAAIREMDSEDVQQAVDQLKQRKPYLFRRDRESASGGSMAGVRGAGSREDLEDAAADAAATGSRGDLLRYLKAKRSK